MRRRLELATIVLAALMPALGATAVRADWLVMSDGVEIETRGPWRVEGERVVFTGANGRLASLRLSDCDLEASASLTAARKRPAPPSAVRPSPPSKPGGAVLTLTDADVEHVRPAPRSVSPRAVPNAEDGRAPRRAAPPETGAQPAADAAGEVVVARWSPKDEEDGIAIRGELRNDSSDVAGRVKVVAVFKDADGETLEKRPAALSASTLRPGQKAEFVVRPFGLYSYGSVEFEIRHFTLLSGAVEGPAAGGGR